MPIYMKYGSIDGNVTKKGQEKKIQVESFQWGVGRGVTMEVGRGSDRSASKPSFSDVVVTKALDCASTLLFNHVVSGQEGTKVTFDFMGSGQKEDEVFMVVTLEDVLISSYSCSSGGEGVPTESWALNYGKVEWQYKGADAKGAKGGQVVAAYDLRTGTA
jgi:type VI secretion system secreted protein Hcp